MIEAGACNTRSRSDGQRPFANELEARPSVRVQILPRLFWDKRDPQLRSLARLLSYQSKFFF